MNTMKLAWSNARAAAAWHGKGKAQDYLAGSLSLAHQHRDLRKEYLVFTATTGVAAFVTGIMLGAALAL